MKASPSLASLVKSFGNLLSKPDFARTQTPRIVGIIGDSRFASAYTKYTPTVTTVTGDRIAITAPSIGTNEAIGSSFILGRSTGCDMIEAVIESSSGANNVVAVIKYPHGPLPSGAIVSAGSVILMQTSRPTISTSYPTWLLALTNQAVSEVINFAYHGCRIQSMITHQIKRAKERGCTEIWFHGSANDYLSNVDGKTSAYVTEKLEEAWAACKGMKIVHFSETALGSTYYSTANAQKVVDINTWAQANASAYAVDYADLYTPTLNVSTGQALANVLQDGLHPALWGARLTMVAAVAGPLFARFFGKYKANLTDLATAMQPVANPTMAGTLGASQVPTGYTSSVSGLVTIGSYSLNAKTVETNEFVVNVTSTGAGSHYLKGAATTVISGSTYRFRGKVAITSGVNVNYIECTIRNASGDGLLATPWAPLNYGTVGGDADGTYDMTYDFEYTIPAGVTSIYLRPRIFFGTVAGSATIGYRDEEMRGVSRSTKITSPAVSSSSPSDPTGNSTTSQLMMGLAGSFTPLVGSRARFVITGQAANNTVLDGCAVQLRYGTGTAPVNGAAATGTQLGATLNTTSLVAGDKKPFSLEFPVLGLTPGTPYWIDASIAGTTGGTATLTDVNIVANEYPSTPER